MKLKKIAVLALIFTTITGINAEPVTAVTNAVVTEAPAQETETPAVDANTNQEANTNLSVETPEEVTEESTDKTSDKNNKNNMNNMKKEKRKEGSCFSLEA